MTRTDPLTPAAPLLIPTISGCAVVSTIAHVGVLPSQPAPPSRDTKPGLRRVSTAGVAKKTTETPASKYPDFPASPEVLEISDRITERNRQFVALKGALETDKAELGKVHVLPWFLQHFHGKSDVPSSVLVRGAKGITRVTVKDAYPKLPIENDAKLLPILGEDLLNECFRQRLGFELDGDKVPQDRLQEFVDKLKAVCAEFACEDALAVKDLLVPVDNFKALRFTRLTVAQNLQLEQLTEKGFTQVAISPDAKA